MMDKETESCPNCGVNLNEPYILCKGCKPAGVKICLHCFSKGVEFNNHESDHPYSVIKRDFPLFDSNWTAMDEESLLDVMAECGFGNWSDVAQQIHTKSKWECEMHYNKYYIQNPEPPLPELPGTELQVFPQPVMYKLSDDPPRYADCSLMYQEMGGYMAGRGDFNTEYDNFSELDLKTLEFDDSSEEDEIENQLKHTVLDIYRNRLKERQRRKQIVRIYGLINMRKLSLCNRRFHNTIKDIIDSLRVFARLVSPFDFDKFIEGLHYEYELKNEIKKLKEFREDGLTSMRQLKVYKNLKNRRREFKSKGRLLDEILVHVNNETACQSWLQRQVVLENISKGVTNIPLPNAPRRSAQPLEIVGLPGHEKLNSDEREICATARLVPEAYLEFKSILVSECKKQGCLKLGQARNLIKIDVNKTRKLFDFLVSQGLLNKEPL